MKIKQLNTGGPIELVQTMSGVARLHTTAEWEGEPGYGSWNVRGYRSNITFEGAAWALAAFEHYIVLIGGGPFGKVHVRAAFGPVLAPLTIDIGCMEDENGDPVPYDETLECTMTTRMLCDEFEGIVSQPDGGAHASHFFAPYTADNNSGGIPPQNGELWYEPHWDGEGKCCITTEYTLTVGTTTVTGYTTTHIYRDTYADEYRHGFAQPVAAIQADRAYYGWSPFAGYNWWTNPFDAEDAAGSFDIGGQGIGGPYTVTGDHNSTQWAHAIATGSSVEYYTCGAYRNEWQEWETFPVGLEMTCPEIDISYLGSLTHWDGTNLAGSFSVQVGDLTSHAGSNGAISTSIHYNGQWWFGFYQTSGLDEWIENEQYYDIDDTGGLLNGNSISLGICKLLNCRDLNQPDYPFPSGWDPDVTYNWLEHNDSRIELDLPGFEWVDVLQLDVPMSKIAVSFLATDPWTTESGAAAFAECPAQDGKIRISVTQDNTVAKCDYTDFTLAGARYAGIVYESDDTEPITIEIAGRQFTITPGEQLTKDHWIDLLCPDNQALGLVGQTQSVRALVTEDMAYYDNYVVSGLLPAMPNGIADPLTSDIGAGTAILDGVSISRDATPHTYTASKDTYVRLTDTSYAFDEVANEAAAPSIPAGTLLIAKVVTNATAVMEVVDLHTETYVDSGLLPATSADLTSDIEAGSAMINGTTYTESSATPHTYTASKDTYVDYIASGFNFQEVTNGAAAPDQPANSVRLAKVVTDTDNITSVVDLRSPFAGVNEITDGLMPVVPASLESYVRGGNAFIDETPVEKVATLLTYTGDQDNYLFLHKTNGFTISTVNHGAAAPSTPALSIPLAKVVTTYNVITSIVDLRDMNAETVSEPLVDVPWDWGIHSAETIKLIGLRSGKYYDLKTVTLHRNSEDCEVHLFRCPFVSDEPGNARSADDYSLYQIASKTWWSENQQDNITSYTKITRIGVVIVDGVVGAELFGMGHIFLPSSVQPRWTHFHLSPENGNFMYPPGGLVEATVLEPDIPASYIGHGIVTVTGDTHTFDAQGYCSSIIMPLDESSKSFGFTKKLEGQPLIRAINRQSQAITGTLKTYLGTEQIDTESVSIPASGICVIPSKHQAVMDFGTVTSGTGTTYIMSGVNVRDYTGFTLYAKDRNDPVTPLGCTIVSHNTTTGEMVLGHDFGTDGLLDGDEVSVHLPYSYKLIVGTKTVSFDLRNRSLAFATMLTRVGTGMLLYDATNATGALLYDPATGALLYDA